jgi:hypothetical protein
MADIKNPEQEQDSEAETFDAFIVLHQPTQNGVQLDVEPYAIGPYPPIKELADMVLAATKCECVKTVVGLAFPGGVRMALIPDSPEELAAALNSLGIGEGNDGLVN